MSSCGSRYNKWIENSHTSVASICTRNSSVKVDSICADSGFEPARMCQTTTTGNLDVTSTKLAKSPNERKKHRCFSNIRTVLTSFKEQKKVLKNKKVEKLVEFAVSLLCFFSIGLATSHSQTQRRGICLFEYFRSLANKLLTWNMILCSPCGPLRGRKGRWEWQKSREKFLPAVSVSGKRRRRCSFSGMWIMYLFFVSLILEASGRERLRLFSSFYFNAKHDMDAQTAWNFT